LATSATVGEVKKFIREKIEEKKKKIRRPEIAGHAYIDKVLAELEILQMVMAEIYDIGRRKDLAKEYEEKKKAQENIPKSDKINVVT
jgi:nitrogen regulatory protein PII